MIQFVIVFAVTFALDLIWPFYMRSAAAGHATRGALWAVAIMVASSAMTIAYTADPWMVLPACLGAFGGTFAAIKIKARWL